MLQLNQDQTVQMSQVCQQYHTRRRPQIRNKDFAQNKTKNIVNTIEIVNFKILPAAYQLRRQPAGHAAASADADGAAKAALRRVQPAAAAAVEQHGHEQQQQRWRRLWHLHAVVQPGHLVG
jgi:hypothetical protein